MKFIEKYVGITRYSAKYVKARNSKLKSSKFKKVYDQKQDYSNNQNILIMDWNTFNKNYNITHDTNR